MNVEIGTVAAQFAFLGIFVSNFRYCFFAVWFWKRALIKKKIKIFLIYKEIQNGAVAKSYMTNGLLITYLGKYLRISSHIRKPFLIYNFATAPLWISLHTREIWFSFLSVRCVSSLPWPDLGRGCRWCWSRPRSPARRTRWPPSESRAGTALKHAEICNFCNQQKQNGGARKKFSEKKTRDKIRYYHAT